MRKGWLTVGALAALALSMVVNAESAAAATPITTNGAWTVYHHDNAHTGYDSSIGAATGAAAGWVSAALDGDIYGEPLVYRGIVYVATLNNTIYALNQTDGTRIWSRYLGAPQTSGWGCGNINPTGTLSTGVIDTARSRIYIAPFLHQFLSYYVYGLDLATGAIVLHTPVRPSGFDWRIQQQRGALAISKDGSHVYVPFGGRAGDCGAYNGWVVGVPTNGAAANEVYKTPSHASGVWASGGVVVENSTGNVLFGTGNAIPCAKASSDSVIRTTATLTSPTFFQPADWDANWCEPDQDLGSAAPLVISPTLGFITGKYGQGFLFNPASPGGTNGQLFPAKSPYVGADVCGGNHADESFGSFAYAAPRLYLECDNFGLVSLTVNTSIPSFSLCGTGCNATGTWLAGSGHTFGPPIVAGGIVWVVDIDGQGLYGYDASTGSQIYHSAGFGVNHFTTPSEAGGQIFVGANNVVREFRMLRCMSVSANASVTSPREVGAVVTISAVAAGCPNPSPSYHFGILAPGQSTYTTVQGYSTTSTYQWDTTGLTPGTYRFSVWAMDANSSGLFGNSSGRWDAFNNSLTFTLTSCTALSVSTSPGSPAAIGTSIQVHAAASGCTQPLYHFGVLGPGQASYTTVQDYSPSAAYSWSTSGLVPGTYRFSVWVRDSGSAGAFGNAAGRWDVYNNTTTFTLKSCSSLTVTVSPPSPSGAGATVTVTAQAGGCTQPLYHFGLLAPGQTTYQTVQDYSPSAAFTWDTTGLQAGTYRFSVWARDTNSAGAFSNASGAWDTYNNNTAYTVG